MLPVVPLADHALVLGEVVADRLHRLLKRHKQVFPVPRRADVHGMRRVDVQGYLVAELVHLHVHACVDLAAEVRREHLIVGGELPVRHAGAVFLELPLRALAAYRGRQKADPHSGPRRRRARLVCAAGMRPKERAEHAYRRVREKEALAPARREADASDDVEPSVLHRF